MKALPRRAWRDPLNGPTLADRQSRIGGVLGFDMSRRNGFGALPRLGSPRAVLPPSFTSHASRPGSGHLTGMLRVEAVTNRRADGFSGRVLS